MSRKVMAKAAKARNDLNPHLDLEERRWAEARFDLAMAEAKTQAARRIYAELHSRNCIGQRQLDEALAMMKEYGQTSAGQFDLSEMTDLFKILSKQIAGHANDYPNLRRGRR